MARILLLDDDDDLRSVLRKHLVRAGHDVIEAANGRAGLELFRRDPTDVIITDIIMPEKDGLELMIELNREYPGIKYIVISGGSRHAILDYLPAAEFLGAARTVRKPFKAGDLVRLVDELMSEG